MSEPTPPTADTVPELEEEVAEPGADLEVARPTLELLGLEVQLTAPRSLAERYVVVSSAESGLAQPTAIGLAIGLCWPKLRRKLLQDGIAYRSDPPKFGDAVFQWLMTRPTPVSYQAAADVYVAAIGVCAVDLPGLPSPGTPAGDALMGNSEAEEASTSTS